MLGKKASASQFSLMHVPTRSVILLGVTQESRDMAQITVEAGPHRVVPGPAPLLSLCGSGPRAQSSSPAFPVGQPPARFVPYHLQS